MEFITASLTPWHWLTIGVVFFAIELFAPTTFLLWPAIAAVATGLIAWLIPVNWQIQIAIFAVLAIVTTLAGRRFFKRFSSKDSRHPTLNRRGDALKGRVVTLQEPVVNGVGSVTIDSTRWRLVGIDTPANCNLRITGTEGSSLTFEVIG